MTSLDSPGASATDREKVIAPIAPETEPDTSAVTGRSLGFVTDAVTVRSALSVAGSGRSDTTWGSLTLTGPVRVNHTSCQIPMPWSGASGLQSIHVIVRSWLGSTG